MERKQIARRDFFKLAAGVTGVALTGCLPENFVKSLEVTPTLTKTKTPEPTKTVTKTPTETLVPTKTHTPTPEPTATLTSTPTKEPTLTPTPKMIEMENIIELAPKVEGLKAVEKDGKVLYFAEAGNPYGLEQGEQAGELIEFKIGKSTDLSDPAEKQDSLGLVLSPKVVKKFYLETLGGTGDNWKMPFNFDPRGNEIEITEITRNGLKVIQVKSSGYLDIVSPYPRQTLVKYYIGDYRGTKLDKVGLFVSNEDSPEDDINWGISIYYGEGNPTMDNSGKKLSYNEVLVGDVGGQLHSPPFIPGYTLAYAVGTITGPRGISFDNFLKIDDTFVFISK